MPQVIITFVILDAQSATLESEEQDGKPLWEHPVRYPLGNTTRTAQGEVMQATWGHARQAHLVPVSAEATSEARWPARQADGSQSSPRM